MMLFYQFLRLKSRRLRNFNRSTQIFLFYPSLQGYFRTHFIFYCPTVGKGFDFYRKVWYILLTIRKYGIISIHFLLAYI